MQPDERENLQRVLTREMHGIDPNARVSARTRPDGKIDVAVVSSLFIGKDSEEREALFWPILQTIPFQIRGLRAREVALASAAMMVMVNLSFAFGPAFTGILSEGLGSMRAALAVVCCFPAIAVVGGLLMREPEPSVVAVLEPEAVS